MAPLLTRVRVRLGIAVRSCRLHFWREVVGRDCVEAVDNLPVAV